MSTKIIAAIAGRHDEALRRFIRVQAYRLKKDLKPPAAVAVAIALLLASTFLSAKSCEPWYHYLLKQRLFTATTVEHFKLLLFSFMRKTVQLRAQRWAVPKCYWVRDFVAKISPRTNLRRKRNGITNTQAAKIFFLRVAHRLLHVCSPLGSNVSLGMMHGATVG